MPPRVGALPKRSADAAGLHRLWLGSPTGVGVARSLVSRPLRTTSGQRRLELREADLSAEDARTRHAQGVSATQVASAPGGNQSAGLRVWKHPSLTGRGCWPALGR